MLDLAAIGLTKEEVQNRVIEKLCDELKGNGQFDYDDVLGSVQEKLQEWARKSLDENIEKAMNEQILPRIPEIFEKMALQEVTKWGEKKGEPKTFKEYCVARAESWVTEQVDYTGKAKGEGDSYNWSGKCSRLAYMIHAHLHRTLEDVVKKALADANAALGKSVVDACQQKVSEIVSAMKVAVTVGK